MLPGGRLNMESLGIEPNLEPCNDEHRDDCPACDDESESCLCLELDRVDRESDAVDRWKDERNRGINR